jgi:DNA (cytosine-5)-methyltransferase 1
MLWEVERILDELKEENRELPQVLVMENVPEVIGTNNIKHFAKWLEKLEQIGYKNKWQVLNAKDYGVPQNRERCFMVSMLGDYNYNFPKKITLEKKLKDLLEDNVNEKYYLSDKQLAYILDAQDVALKGGRDINNRTINPDIAKTISCRGAVDQRADVTNFAIDGCDEEITVKDLKLRIKEATKKGYKEAYEGDDIDISGRMETHRGTVQSGMAQTIKTSIDVGVVVKDEPKVIGGIGEKKSNNGTQWYQQDRIYDDNIAISVTTICNPYYKSDLRIRKLTPKECFRLMGVKDEDYENIAKNQSNSKLYHLAGDAIVIQVLEQILKQLL